MASLTLKDRLSYYKPVSIDMDAVVVHGFRRGHSIGFPTANLNPEEVPEDIDRLETGVYFGYSSINSTDLDIPTVISICNNPTFNHDKLCVEAHLLKHFEHEFYGERIHLTLKGFIRPPCKFSGIEELKEAIALDVAFTKTMLKV